jgi:hypothetical protein
MINIDIETLLTIVYVLVDDWYEAAGKEFLKGKYTCQQQWQTLDGLLAQLVDDFLDFA